MGSGDPPPLLSLVNPSSLHSPAEVGQEQPGAGGNHNGGQKGREGKGRGGSVEHGGEGKGCQEEWILTCCGNFKIVPGCSFPHLVQKWGAATPPL